jgi:hypothetical protein
MSEVMKGLWISGYDILKSKEWFNYIAPTHILNCAEELSPTYLDPKVVVHKIPLIDDVDEEAVHQILEGADILRKWISPTNHVVVHCKAGISRSATVILAWMILYNSFSYNEAFDRLREARNIIQPNPFYTDILKNLKPLDASSCSSEEDGFSIF